MNNTCKLLYSFALAWYSVNTHMASSIFFAKKKNFHQTSNTHHASLSIFDNHFLLVNA